MGKVISRDQGMNNRALSLQSPLVYTSDNLSLQPALWRPGTPFYWQQKEKPCFNYIIIKHNGNQPQKTLNVGTIFLISHLLKVTMLFQDRHFHFSYLFPKFQSKGQFKLLKLIQRPFKLKETKQFHLPVFAEGLSVFYF